MERNTLLSLFAIILFLPLCANAKIVYKVIDLGTLGGLYSEAYSINDAGQIVGVADGHATLFDPTGTGNNIDLGTVIDSVDGDQSCAYSINNTGQIVGLTGLYDPFMQFTYATLFDPTGSGNNIDLGSFHIGLYAVAWSINDAGQIVGTAYRRATLFDPTGAGNNTNLNTLIDPASGWNLVYAYSINNHGWIVGGGINPAGLGHAYLLIPEPTTIALLGLGGLVVIRRRRG